MNIIKKCFTVVVSMAMCTAVMVQPFGDNIRTLKSEVVSYAVDSESSTAEHYADVVMNNYDTCSDLVDLSVESYPARPAVGSFSFMDIDFDGELEFIVHRCEAGTRRGGSAEIFKIDGNNLKSIMRVNDTFIENFEGFYCDENGNKFFIGYKSAGGFGGIASGLYKMYIKDGQLVEEELFRETDWNAPASGDLYGTHEYHQNGEKIDVTEDEYNARIEEYKSSLTNLNLSYQQSSSFNSFEEMSDEEKREFLISSYNAFNYDGFQRQDDNTSDDDSINKTWQELYAEELRNYMNSDKYSDETMFDLYDIDGDGIPEMFISNNTGHADSAVSVYGYDNGTITKFGEYSAYGCGGILSYYIQSNTLSACSGMHGKFHTELYNKKNNTMVSIISLYDNVGDVGEDSDKAIYQINGETVSCEEYKEQIDKYLYGEAVRVGRKYTLDEETIKAVLLNGTNEPTTTTTTTTTTNTTTTTTTTVQPAEKTWQELYAEELRNYMNSNRYSDDAMFDLYDMNDDEIPELIISEGLPTIRECIIYTMYEEKLINLGEYGSYGGVGFNTDKKLLLSLYDHQGYFSYGLYGLSNGVFEKVFSAYNDANAVGEEKATYKINGEIVNAEKYNEELLKYESNNCVWLGRKYNIDEETIKSVLLNGGYEDDNNDNQDKTYGDYTYRINENDEIVIVKYNGSDENVEIPSEIDGRKVTVISGVEGPADLEYPRIGAFEANSAIKSVVIPDTVTKIEMNSFRACDNLQYVTMSENIQTIEQYAFSDCNLSYIYLPESISDIGDCAFGYSGGSVIDDFVIYGFTGTVAETYANNNEILFIVRNNDETIIQPLDISLDYEKVSTLPNDDTVQLINFPVYKITAKIKNIDIKTADNVSVELAPSEEMSLIGSEKIQTTEIISSNEEVTFTWTVKIDTSKSYSTECKVYAKADNSVKSESYLTIAFENTVTEKDNRFDFTKDTWKFTNSNIKPTYYFSKGYYIQEKYLTKLYQRLPNTAIQKVKELLNSEWGGSCYGISVVAILDKLDILDVTDYDENATCVHDAKSPAESDEISSLINAYQVSQTLQPVQIAKAEFKKLSTNEKLHRLVDAVEIVKSGGIPVALGLNWYLKDASMKDKGDYKTAGHRIVAYDIERLEKPYKVKNVVTGAKEDYSIRISLYDCSASGDKPIYMYITEDYNHWSIPELCGGYACQDYREEISRPLEGGRYDTLYYKNEADFNIITDPSVLDCFSWTDFTSNYNAVLSVNNKTNLLIKWNNSTYKFMIDKLVDGAYNAGEEITTFFSNAGAEDLDGVSQANINYVLPSLDGEYIISDPDGNATDIDYTLTYGNSMISAEASGAKSVTFNTDSVSVEADNSDYELAMTFNEDYYSMPWYTITASGNEANIVSMEQTDNGVILNSDNMESVTISANNTDETVELTFTADTDNVLISNNDENNLEIYEDTDNNGSYETLVSTTASDDETDTNQDNSANNSSESQTSNSNSKADNNPKSLSTASSPQTGDNITRGIPALVMAVAAMIIFRKRK